MESHGYYGFVCICIVCLIIQFKCSHICLQFFEFHYCEDLFLTSFGKSLDFATVTYLTCVCVLKIFTHLPARVIFLLYNSVSFSLPS